MDNLLWIQQLHLIRPYWLFAIFPAALAIWVYSRTQIRSRNWASVIDERLLPHLLQGVSHAKKPAPLIKLSIISLSIISLIIIVALAGPAFEKRPQPVFKTQSALILILDLSRSMDATDIKPSRLSRARFKINDIVKQRKEGQTGLIVYAANAYVVSPLTDDAETIASQVPALETHIMPAQGSRLDIALEKALQLFNNAGHSRGEIIVITDSISSNDKKVLSTLSGQNFNTSILAVGTKDGAPISSQNGGFVKDNDGSIVVPKLDISNLRSAATSGSGKFSLLTANDRDITHLLSAIDINRANQTDEASPDDQLDDDANKFKTDIWHEVGPWLLLLVIPFVAYVFRKGLVFLLLIFVLPLPQPAQAFEWSSLWQNSNQRGEAALQQGDVKRAADLFNNPEWKAAAQYKAGEYQQSADLLNNIDTADANYNRGNALAKAGDFKQAISAYERTLEITPDHEDAKYNKKLLEQKQDEPSEQDQSNQDQSSEDQANKDESNPNQSNSDKSDPGQSESDQSQQSQSSENQQDAEEQNKAENQGQSNKTDEENKNTDPEKNQTAESENDNQSPENSEEDKQNKTPQQMADSQDTPDLEQQQTQQWLKKIPDDPGGLLRRKFKYQYGREQNQNEQNPW